jgi:hypothetical protein
MLSRLVEYGLLQSAADDLPPLSVIYPSPTPLHDIGVADSFGQ